MVKGVGKRCNKRMTGRVVKQKWRTGSGTDVGVDKVRRSKGRTSRGATRTTAQEDRNISGAMKRGNIGVTRNGVAKGDMGLH